jgi:hypothetical protein
MKPTVTNGNCLTWKENIKTKFHREEFVILIFVSVGKLAI